MFIYVRIKKTMLFKKNLLTCSTDGRIPFFELPEGFDIAKALLVLDRVIDSEIDFLEREPEDYLDIYG